ncbi:MAG: hypothetical protein JWM33_1330, partial [Caulobacteraceae bacterium]|nr:hypothetical protein [Caulobacteraceae bacterium]
DEYREGWRLQSISPTKVTVIKDGEAHEIGLNPTGAVAENAPPPPPSEVTMLRAPADAAMVQRAIDRGHWDGKPMIGLSMEESRIVAASRQMQSDWAVGQRKARGLGEMASISFSRADQIAILGSQEAADDWAVLESRTGRAKQASWNGDAMGFLQDRYDEYVTRLPALSPDSQEYQQLVRSRDSVLQEMADLKVQRQTDPRAGFVTP